MEYRFEPPYDPAEDDFDDENESWEEDEDVDYGHRYDDRDDYIEFMDLGGRSALRAASDSNPRNLPCPTCGMPNRLTPEDKRLGYQCDECADRAERGIDW